MNLHTALVTTRAVTVFFYGTYLNLDVLAEVGLHPARFDVAQLAGHEITVQPLANIRREPSATVFGLLSEFTHGELARLYHHAEHVLGGVYLPEAVLVRTTSGVFEPALCYVSHSLQPSAADNAYVDRILEPAKRWGFPAWYLARLASFKH